MSDQAMPLPPTATDTTASPDATERDAEGFIRTAHMKPQAFALPPMKLAMWIFLSSEVIFFSALIGTGIVLRMQSPETWATPGEVLNVPLTSLNTFILIVSSVTVVLALQAIQEGKRIFSVAYMGATLALGALFLGIQAFEYWQLIGHGLYLEQYTVVHETLLTDRQHHDVVQSLYGMAFYIQTGFHGLHVLAGVIWLAVVFVKALGGAYSPTNYTGFEVFGLYWHFVDLVWIILFTIVYLV